MTDLHVTVKFRNAALLRAIKKSGAKSVSQFCKKYNLAQTVVGAFILLKASPLLKNGEWTKTAWDLSSALHCEPDDIFPTAATRRILVKREYSFEADSENLLTQDEMKALPVGVVKKLDNALNCLTPSQKDVVERRLSGETYAEIAIIHNRSLQRIRDIEQKALRLLSHPARGLSRTMIEDVQSS